MFISDPKYIKKFKLIAKKFTKDKCRTKQIALSCLIKEGICDKEGNLTKSYK